MKKSINFFVELVRWSMYITFIGIFYLLHFLVEAIIPLVIDVKNTLFKKNY